MAVYLSPVGGVAAQFFDNNGTPLAGGLIYTYAAGTSTPATTYTSSSGIIAHSNPIVLDASGRVPTGEIWLADTLSYKFVIKTAQDVLIASYDNISGINSNFIAYTAQQEIQTATAGQTVFNLATMSYQPGTNNLSVFVDGVNQYGPGAQYAYVETDSDTVTFVSGLHVGASVKFTTATPVASAVVNAENVAYNPPFFGAVGTNVEAKLAQSKAAQDFETFDDYINETLNGYYAGQGGEIQRLTDRVFMGGAAWNTGQQTTLNNDWLTTFQNSIGRNGGWIQISQTAALNAENPQGVIGFLAASQSKYITLAGLNSIGAVFMGVNNSTVLQNTYAVYTEAYRMSGATGGAYGIEIDTINYAGLQTIDSYTQDIKQTIGIQLAAGGELSPGTQYPSSAAINIRKNGSTFQRGIIFGNDALTDCDGTTGTAIAIEMAKGHGIHWLKSAGVYTCAIYGIVSDSNKSTTMTFDDNGVVFKNPNTGTNVFNIGNIGQTSVNYPAFNPSLTGNPVQFTAQGTDTNIDIELVPKGLGLVRIGPWYSNADAAVNGYVAVKDSSGTVRKLATIA